MVLVVVAAAAAARTGVGAAAVVVAISSAPAKASSSTRWTCAIRAWAFFIRSPLPVWRRSIRRPWATFPDVQLAMLLGLRLGMYRLGLKAQKVRSSVVRFETK